MSYFYNKAQQMSDTLKQNQDMYNTAAKMIQPPGAITPATGKLPGEILSPTTTSDSLVENTKNIVDESEKYMKTNIFPNGGTNFNISQSIYWSLMQHVIQDTDDAKYEIMDKLFSFITNIATQITPEPVVPIQPPQPMFGGNGLSEQSKEVLLYAAVDLKPAVDSNTIKGALISQTKSIIDKCLSIEDTKKHVQAKLQPIINAQCQSIKDEIEAHVYTEPPKPMFGGASGVGDMHFFMNKAIEQVKNTYFKIISDSIDIEELKPILNYCFIVALNIPNGQENVKKMENSVKHMIMKKDEVSKKVVDAMDLKTKISHIIQYIDKNPALNDNLLDCIKKNINQSCINDNFFVPILGKNSKCVEQTLSKLAENTQIKYNSVSDEVETRSRSIDSSENKQITPLNFPEQTLDSEKMIQNYQKQIKFKYSPLDSDPIISQEVWDIIIKKIGDVDIDDASKNVNDFLDMYVKIYENITSLSNHGLFLLFNDKHVIEKMNSCLLLFADYMYNVDLATCDNQRGLTPDMNEENGQIRIIAPPERPNKELMSKLILFVFKHHLRHFSGANPAAQPNEISVQLNTTMENSSIYYGFEKELNEFINSDAELKDNEIVKKYVDVIFKKYINELKNKVYEKELQIINDAMNKISQKQSGGKPTTKTRRRKKHSSLRMRMRR